MNRLMHWLEQIIVILMAAMFGMIALLVMLRYLFGSTIIGGNEATVIAFVYTTSIGAAINLWRREHIAVTYFVRKLSPPWQSRLDRLVSVLLLLLNAVIALYALGWIQKTGGFLMPALGWPQWVAQASIPLGASLGVLASLAALLKGTET